MRHSVAGLMSEPEREPSRSMLIRVRLLGLGDRGSRTAKAWTGHYHLRDLRLALARAQHVVLSVFHALALLGDAPPLGIGQDVWRGLSRHIVNRYIMLASPGQTVLARRDQLLLGLLAGGNRPIGTALDVGVKII